MLVDPLGLTPAESLDAAEQSRLRGFMEHALAEAHKAPLVGEVPVGSVVVFNGEIVARAHNRRNIDSDPTAHAELLAMREAARVLGDWRLEGCEVFVTLEPCPMCAGAMVLARVERCIFGCFDPKAGFMGSLTDLSSDVRLNHRFPVVTGVEEEACSEALRQFFRELRARRKAERRRAREEEDQSPS
jgi:tRNA(Arg) A34 adenosine deaminase TadA